MKIKKSRLKEIVMEEITKNLEEYDLEKMARYEPSAAAHLAQKRAEKGGMSAAELEAEKAKKYKLARQKEKAAQAAGGDDKPDWLMDEAMGPEVQLEQVASDLAETLEKLGELMHVLDGKGLMDYSKVENEILGQVNMRLGKKLMNMKELNMAIAEVLGLLA